MKKVFLFLLSFVLVLGLSACYTKSVEFIVDDEIYHTVSVKSDELIPEPADPTKDGYTFLGWWEQSIISFEEDRLWNFEEDYTFDQLQLFAKWERASITLTIKNFLEETVAEYTVESHTTYDSLDLSRFGTLYYQPDTTNEVSGDIIEDITVYYNHYSMSSINYKVGISVYDSGYDLPANVISYFNDNCELNNCDVFVTEVMGSGTSQFEQVMNLVYTEEVNLLILQTQNTTELEAIVAQVTSIPIIIINSLFTNNNPIFDNDNVYQVVNAINGYSAGLAEVLRDDALDGLIPDVNDNGILDIILIDNIYYENTFENPEIQFGYILNNSTIEFNELDIYFAQNLWVDANYYVSYEIYAFENQFDVVVSLDPEATLGIIEYNSNQDNPFIFYGMVYDELTFDLAIANGKLDGYSYFDNAEMAAFLFRVSTNLNTGEDFLEGTIYEYSGDTNLIFFGYDSDDYPGLFDGFGN